MNTNGYKKQYIICSIYILFCCMLLSFSLVPFTSTICSAHPLCLPSITQQQINACQQSSCKHIDVTFYVQNQTFHISQTELQQKFATLSRKELQNQNIEQKIMLMQRIAQQGFTKQQSIMYVFPELVAYMTWLQSVVEKPAQNATICYQKAQKQVYVQADTQGVRVQTEALYGAVYDALLKKPILQIHLPMYVEKPQITQTQAQAYAQPMATFATKFATSNAPRAHNIAQALRAFDGYILPPQAEVSFNQTTGVRNQQNGYLPAKIIQNGTYVEGYGGGVCQASTTLYNAALLAGLTITEVHAHSLQVGYVQAGFDAMVNIGSSDLKIKNPFSYPVLFSTKVENGTCQVTVYGKPSGLTIKRQSKVIKTLPAPKPKMKKAHTYNGEPLYLGQQVWQTYGKAGAQTQSYIHIYKNGKKIDTQKIRENYYASTQGVVIEGTTPCPEGVFT